MDLGKINPLSDTPKFLQIANRITELIQNRELMLGDRVPSINQVISHYSVSRDTAVKAYNELKRRGIIEAKPNRAFFVANDYINYKKKILLILDNRTPYKEDIFYGLIDSLPEEYYVDLFVHGDNFDTLRVIYEKARLSGQYSGFLIVPTAAQNFEKDYFQYINGNDIVFIDRPVENSGIPGVYQEFKEGFYSALKQKRKILKKYKKLVFYTKHYTNIIIEGMKEGIQQYCKESKTPFEQILTEFTPKSIKGVIKIEKDILYLALDDLLLVECIKVAQDENMVAGKDYGLLGVNNNPFFDVMCSGLCRITTDFYEMGVQALAYLMGENNGNIAIPTIISEGNTI